MPTAISFSRDGRTLLAGTLLGGLSVWDVAAGKLVRAWERPSKAVTSIAWSADGRSVATSWDDGTVRLWDPATGAELAEYYGHERSVNCVAFTGDGKMLASGGDDGTIDLRDTGFHPRPQLLISHRENRRLMWDGHPVIFSGDGRILISAVDDQIDLWDVTSGQRQRRLSGYGQSAPAKTPGPVRELTRALGAENLISSVAASPDGRLVAASGDSGTQVWEIASGREVAALAHASDGPCRFIMNGKTLAAGGKLWDVQTWKERAAPDAESLAAAVAFSRDGALFVSHAMRVCETASGKERTALTGQPPVAFSPDGCLAAATVNGQEIEIQDIAAGKKLGTLRGHTSFITGLTFTPDGAAVVSCSQDGSVKFWDPTTLQERLTLRFGRASPRSVAFAAAGDILAVGWSPEFVGEAQDAAVILYRAAPLPVHAGR